MTDTSVPGAADVAPAEPVRKRLTWPETRDTLAVLSTLLVAFAFAMPWLRSIPKGSEQNVGQMQGAILVQWAMVMSWYFGSSKSAVALRDQVGQALSKLPDGGGQA